MLTGDEQTVRTRPDVRAALLEAADRLIQMRGARGLTTREIAREAGCSDSALYVHFADKAHLLASVCERWLPDLTNALGDLINRVGVATVQANLEAICATALRAYREMAPQMYAIAGDPELLAYHRAALRAAQRGPRRGIEAFAAYIAAEQRLGRVRAGSEPVMAANVLLGSCWQRAAMHHYFGADIIEVDDDAYISSLAATVMRGLQPGGHG
jgi:AcrR family transcriptional regulator